jgi:hypothetical protein
LDAVTIELREAAPDDAAALALVAAGDILVAHAGRSGRRSLAALRTCGTGIGDTRQVPEAVEDRARALGEANRLYRRAGYREIPDYNANPRANRWYGKPSPEFP